MNSENLKAFKKKKGGENMSLVNRTSAFVKSLTSSVCAMGGMICSNESTIDVQIKLINTMMELEILTSELIDEYEMYRMDVQGIAICRRRYIQNNKRVLAHIEKLQLKGYKLETLKEALKLENSTLEKQLKLMY